MSPALNVTTIRTDELGDRSYIVDDGEWAAVVDPQRDIDRWIELVDDRGLRVAVVCETHRHNDYVTGGAALAKELGAAYVVPSGDVFDRCDEQVIDGQRITFGDLALRAISTPGHTLGHVAYVASAPGSVDAVFTGGSLLYGNVGRTDLIGPEHTEELALAQLRSVRRLAGELDSQTSVFPTHGFGSFCAAGPAGGDGSTIGAEIGRNLALSDIGDEEWVETLLAGFGDYPSYYSHIGEINRRGPSASDVRPPRPLEAVALRDRIAAGEWVIDLRPATAFAAGHVAGTINAPAAAQLATHVGWLAPWGRRLTLVADKPSVATASVRALSRIGIDRPEGVIGADITSVASAAGAAVHTYPCVTWDVVASTSPRPAVLDVRQDSERATSHVEGSVHVPLHRLPDHLDSLPRETLWVHCQSGYRAAIAASLLDRAGRDAVLILDDLSHAASLGLLVS